MDLQLDGRTALVTGASAGIGRGVALGLAAEGVRLAITARRVDRLDELAGAIAAAGGARPVVIEADMYADDAPGRVAAAAIAGLGHVDILVNNAGGSRAFKDLHVDEARWQEALTLNFHRPRQLAHALRDQMIARGWGRIVYSTGKSEPE
ncbi:MAG: SDR family NAD(P)-dependent oxidoreductase, partial [Alphaproteobacteria bacterium]